METVVQLSHKKPDSVINVKVEFGEGEGKVPLDNIAKRAEAYKPKERVTYKMIKEYIEAKYSFKVHTAYIAEVKRDLGLPMYDAPNAVEELKQPRKHPTAEKVEAIKDALKLWRIVMSSSIFLSYPKPYLKRQEEFIERVIHYLEERELQPRTLGVTDYDMDAPLTAIRRLMLESNGLVTIAFRRRLIKQGMGKPVSDIGEDEYDLSNKWLTSPYCQIEPAMAFQLGLPVLILREKGVIAEGVLEKGVLGVYMPEFDLNCNLDDYFKSKEWIQIIQKWEGYVRKVVENKGKPPMLH